MKMLKWTDKVTNVEVLRRVGELRTLLCTIIKREETVSDPIQRKECLLHDVVDSQVRLKALERRKMQIIDVSREKKKYRDLKAEVQDQQTWE